MHYLKSAVLARLGATCWVLLLGAVPAASAQDEAGAPGTARRRSAGRNVVRLDLLAPVGYNLGYNLFSNEGVVFPVILSYERHLAGRFSLGAEALLNGGVPDDHRNGGSLTGRWYFKESRRAAGPLAGLYLSPVLSYRYLKVVSPDYGPTLTTGRGHRGGAGLLLGLQRPFKRPNAPRLVFDIGVGVMWWSRLGKDQNDNPNAQNFSASPVVQRTGLEPDVRGGLGYQF